MRDHEYGDNASRGVPDIYKHPTQAIKSSDAYVGYYDITANDRADKVIYQYGKF